jgi:hypothetical protein
VLNNELANNMNEIELAYFNPSSSFTKRDYLLDIPSGIDVDKLPLKVKQAFIHVFVVSLQNTFKIGIAMGALSLVSSIFMIKKILKKKDSKKDLLLII